MIWIILEFIFYVLGNSIPDTSSGRYPVMRTQDARLVRAFNGSESVAASSVTCPIIFHDEKWLHSVYLRDTFSGQEGLKRPLRAQGP